MLRPSSYPTWIAARDAENVVAGGKFPPLGKRGLFTSRQGYGVGDYLARANDETLLIALIEDIEAWRNLDEILEVDGIGVFFVAPTDFAASLGHIGDVGHPDVREKIEDSLRRIVAAGRTAGTLCMNDNVQRFAEIGVRCFFTATGPWVAAGARAFKEKRVKGQRQNLTVGATLVVARIRDVPALEGS